MNYGWPSQKTGNCPRCGKPVTWTAGIPIFGTPYCDSCLKEIRREEEKKWEESIRNYRPKKCEKCDGTGKIHGYKCMAYGGTGKK